MQFTDCNRCDDSVKEGDAIDGFCEACYSLDATSEYANTVELPRPVLEKLVGMASTRHPTPCNKIAPRYQRILEEEGML